VQGSQGSQGSLLAPDPSRAAATRDGQTTQCGACNVVTSTCPGESSVVARCARQVAEYPAIVTPAPTQAPSVSWIAPSAIALPRPRAIKAHQKSPRRPPEGHRPTGGSSPHRRVIAPPEGHHQPTVRPIDHKLRAEERNVAITCAAAWRVLAARMPRAPRSMSRRWRPSQTAVEGTARHLASELTNQTRQSPPDAPGSTDGLAASGRCARRFGWIRK